MWFIPLNLLYSPDITLASESKRNITTLGHAENIEQQIRGVNWARMEKNWEKILGNLAQYNFLLPDCTGYTWRPHFNVLSEENKIKDLEAPTKSLKHP